MATSAKRRRQLARQHWERQQARRAEGRHETPRPREVVAIVGVSAVVVAGAIWLSQRINDDSDARPDPASVDSTLFAPATTSPPPV